MRLIRLLNNTSFVLSLAVVMGLAFGQGASYTAPLVNPALMVMMALSMLDISPRIFLDFRRLLLPIVLSIVLSYVVFSGIFMGLSSLIIHDTEIWTGVVLISAVPSAVAVLPYTYHLKGNINLSLVGILATYVASFIITPLVCIAFIGANVVDTGRLLLTLVELIVAPFVVAQLLRRTPASVPLRKYGSLAVSWIIFLMIYTTIGLNRDVFLGEPDILWRVSIGAFTVTFVFTYLINLISRLLGVKKEDRISYTVLGTRKNIGLAVAIALTFFTARTAIPTAITTVFSVVNLVWLTAWFKKMER